jgi:hypothetical protein
LTIVELLLDTDNEFRFGKYLLFELQTMDFHGTPLGAAAKLKNALDSNPTRYHEDFEANPDWAGENIEGPNKANVFKRTIYQIIFEIQPSTTVVVAD